MEVTEGSECDHTIVGPSAGSMSVMEGITTVKFVMFEGKNTSGKSLD